MRIFSWWLFFWPNKWSAGFQQFFSAFATIPLPIYVARKLMLFCYLLTMLFSLLFLLCHSIHLKDLVRDLLHKNVILLVCWNLLCDGIGLQNSSSFYIELHFRRRNKQFLWLVDNYLDDCLWFRYIFWNICTARHYCELNDPIW